MGASVVVEPTEAAGDVVPDDNPDHVVERRVAALTTHEAYENSYDVPVGSSIEAGADVQVGEQYDVIFRGYLDQGEDTRQWVNDAVQRYFGLAPEQVEHLLSSPPATLKRGAPYNEAIQYWVELEAVGARVNLEPVNTKSKDKGDNYQSTEDSGPTETSGRRPQILTGMVIAAFVIALAVVVRVLWM
jgi:hypothetical protein